MWPEGIRPAVGLGVMITGIAGLQYALMQDVYIVDGVRADRLPVRRLDHHGAADGHPVRRRFVSRNPSLIDDCSPSHVSVPGIIIVGSLFMMVSGYLGPG